MSHEIDEAFATADDLRRSWPDMPPGSDETADYLLLEASQFIYDLYPVEVEEASPATLRRVVTSIVQRNMDGPGSGDTAVPSGLSQYMQVAGAYTFQGMISNPHGDFYLTAAEKRSLGVGKQKAFEIDPLAGSVRAHREARS